MAGAQWGFGNEAGIPHVMKPHVGSVCDPSCQLVRFGVDGKLDSLIPELLISRFDGKKERLRSARRTEPWTSCGAGTQSRT